MWIVLFFVSCTSLLVNGLGYYEIVGKGQWVVENLFQCDKPEQFGVQVTMHRKKINRTHDAFDIIMDMDREFNASYGVKVDVYRKVDGGFKYFQTISFKSACDFIKENAEKNWERALTMAKVDPPDCPFGPRPVELRNFVMDYRELRPIGIYGTFMGYVYGTLSEKEIFCAKYIVSFDKEADEESDEDDRVVSFPQILRGG